MPQMPQSISFWVFAAIALAQDGSPQSRESESARMGERSHPFVERFEELIDFMDDAGHFLSLSTEFGLLGEILCARSYDAYQQTEQSGSNEVYESLTQVAAAGFSWLERKAPVTEGEPFDATCSVVEQEMQRYETDRMGRLAPAYPADLNLNAYEWYAKLAHRMGAIAGNMLRNTEEDYSSCYYALIAMLALTLQWMENCQRQAQPVTG